MLVIISDLHLQHTAYDPVRFLRAGSVCEAGVRRNVTKDALDLLFTDVHERVERCHAQSVELVLAGDIFELYRTPEWLLSNADGIRPYGDLSDPIRDRVLGILGRIEAESAAVWTTLRDFVQERKCGRGVAALRKEVTFADRFAIRVHFIPGNHDRLADAWPEVRSKVRNLLSIPDPDPAAPFPHVLDDAAPAPARNYGVRVRHGHEYDPNNIIGVYVPGLVLDPARPQYLAPCLGDYMVVDVATRLAVAFRAFHAQALRDPGPAGERLRRLYLALLEFDDVRPATRLGAYLARAARTDEDLESLRPVLRDVLEAAIAHPFFQAEAARLGINLHDTLTSILVKRVPVRTILDQLSALEAKKEGGASPADCAAWEPGAQDGRTLLVVAGHTHNPDQLPLPGPDGAAQEAFFVDSGTWRTRVLTGPLGCFGRLRSYTAVFCYSPDEQQQFHDRRRFETWTGHLASEGVVFGPYDEPAGPAAPPVQRIRFLKLKVNSVDEGDTRDGAELTVYFGVDHRAAPALNRDHVHDGDEIVLGPGQLVDVSAELDGEVWCWGCERDLGPKSWLDPDDPLPWGLVRLPRQAASGGPVSFVAGPGSLRLCDGRGTDLELFYTVE